MDEIPGRRRGGEEATEDTPVQVIPSVQSDPRLANITETIESHSGKFLLIFTRGDRASTVEFDSEPSDAVVAEYRKQADAVFDAIDALYTTELQDRRRPK